MLHVYAAHGYRSSDDVGFNFYENQNIRGYYAIHYVVEVIVCRKCGTVLCGNYENFRSVGEIHRN